MLIKNTHGGADSSIWEHLRKEQAPYTQRGRKIIFSHGDFVKAIFTNGHVILKATQNGHVILKVTYETNTGFIQNTKPGPPNTKIRPPVY